MRFVRYWIERAMEDPDEREASTIEHIRKVCE